MRVVCILLTYLNLPINIYSSMPKNCIVETENGKIQGREIITMNNNTIYAFMEIPYASPPIGRLRFQEAIAPTNWSGILYNENLSKICWQTEGSLEQRNDPRQSEDCLYLNVYTPYCPVSNGELLPVWIYIYGGGMMYGSASYENVNPQLLVETGIVAVTFNYRTGPLGFLTTEDDYIPANLGIKDQHFALKWTQRNIKFFGGDPFKVVLAGHSSGAICVSYHLMSGKSKGLFRAAILESGTAIMPRTLMKTAKFIAYETGKLFSKNIFISNSSQELRDLLINTSARDISNVNFPHLVLNVRDKQLGKLHWIPVVEKADAKNAFIVSLPHHNLVTGNFHKVPILIGITSEEALTFQKRIPKIAQFYDENTIFHETNIKYGFDKYVEHQVKNIYTNTTFVKDNIALIKLEQPARSMDLTPLDSSLWVFLKSKAYATVPDRVDVLKQRIVDECRTISSDTPEPVR